MLKADNYHQQADVATSMFDEMRKGMMTTVTGRIIDSGPDWVMIEQDWRGGVLESPRAIDYFGPAGRIDLLGADKFAPESPWKIDFAALERPLLDIDLMSLVPPCQTFSYDWLTPVEPSLPQEVIDSRPKPSTILMEINRVSYTGHSEQAEPWRGRVRAARHPVGAVRGRGPRRERW